jgi:hypothetical protein
MIHVFCIVNLDAPSTRYDHKLDKKVEYDQNGVVNLRKLIESAPSLEAGSMKKIKDENNNYKQKYYSLQVNFYIN